MINKNICNSNNNLRQVNVQSSSTRVPSKVCDSVFEMPFLFCGFSYSPTYYFFYA